MQGNAFADAPLPADKTQRFNSDLTVWFFFLVLPPLVFGTLLFSSKIKNEDGLFKTDNSNGPSCNVLLNLSSVNYVVERNLPA